MADAETTASLGAVLPIFFSLPLWGKSGGHQQEVGEVQDTLWAPLNAPHSSQQRLKAPALGATLLKASRFGEHENREVLSSFHTSTLSQK